MAKINLADEKGRNAEISFAPFPYKPSLFWVDENKRKVASQKVIKFTAEKASEKLILHYTNEEDPNSFAQAILNGDPELELHVTGKFISKATRLYLDPSNKPVYKVNLNEKVYDHAGELKEERVPRYLSSNINLDAPIKHSSKLFPKKEVFNKFIFTRSYQLRHNNGLTYDFLFEMAKELQEKDSLKLIGAGNGTAPVVFQDGGNPYRVFLEGKVEGEKYLLLMHLSNMELKPLPV